MISISAISLHVCLFISFRKGYKLYDSMHEDGFKKDIWFNRFLIQNGLGFFLTWLSLATNLNFAVFLTYDASVKVDISSTVVLIIILALIITYFVLENFIWQRLKFNSFRLRLFPFSSFSIGFICRYLLYLVTPWFVLNLALIGSIAKNFNGKSPTRNNIITVILLVIVVIFTIIKIIMFILYHTKLKHKVKRAICRKSSASSTQPIMD